MLPLSKINSPTTSTSYVRSDVLGQFMPLVGKDWTHSGIARLFSAIKVFLLGFICELLDHIGLKCFYRFPVSLCQ